MHGSIRLFVAVPLAAGAEIASTAGQAHYLGAVMRRGTGDPVRLFNGKDGEWTARITQLRREHARFEVEERARPPEPEPDCWLAFAPLKRDCTELVVQKATELGVSAILPVVTERTNTPHVNQNRLAAIATEAAEQCERLTVPTISAPARLAALLDAWPTGRTLVAAVERFDGAPLGPHAGTAALLVGPEGGFTAAELDVLRASPFVVMASLGPRILRAETAAIVGLGRLLAPTGG